MATYDRYSKFRNNGQVSMVPFIPIPVRDTDYYESFCAFEKPKSTSSPVSSVRGR